MKKKILSAIALCVCITLFSAFSVQQNNKKVEIIKWNGKEITFKAVEEIRLTGVSVVADGKELKTTGLSNTSGDMKFPNGATMRAGSSLMWGTDRTFIVLKETTVVCELGNSIEKASKVYFYLEGGSKIEVNL